MAEYSPIIGTVSNACPGEIAQYRPPLARRRLVFSDNFDEIFDDGHLVVKNNEDDSDKENRVPSMPKRNRTVASSPFYPSPVSTSSPVSARVRAASNTPDIIRQMKHQRHEEGFRFEENLPWMLRVGEQEYYFPQIQDVLDLTVFLHDIMMNRCGNSPQAVDVFKGDGNNHVPTPFDGLGHGAAVNETVSVILPRNGNNVASPPANPYLEAGSGVSKVKPIVDPEPSGHHNHAPNDIGYFKVYRSYDFPPLAILGTYFLFHIYYRSLPFFFKVNGQSLSMGAFSPLVAAASRPITPVLSSTITMYVNRANGERWEDLDPWIFVVSPMVYVIEGVALKREFVHFLHASVVDDFWNEEKARKLVPKEHYLAHATQGIKDFGPVPAGSSGYRGEQSHCVVKSVINDAGPSGYRVGKSPSA